MGYYRDAAYTAGAMIPAGQLPSASSPVIDNMQALQQEPEAAGWLAMRTVAQLRREAGIGAPRKSDSLYRPILRRLRAFNPLKIPKALQVCRRFSGVCAESSHPKVTA